MKKQTLILLLFVILAFEAGASEKSSQQKNEVNISFSNCPLEYDWWFNNNILLFNLNYNYRISRFVGAGAYAGVGLYDDYFYYLGENTANSGTDENNLISKNFGVNANLYLLPFVFKKELSWIDVYLTCKAGAIYLPSNTEPRYSQEEPVDGIVPARGTYFDGSLFGGIKIFPTNSIGLFGEYGYRTWYYYKGFQVRYGITIRF